MNEHIQKAAAVSTVTSKGQTTIPKQFRDALGIKDGTALRWTLEEGVLQVRGKTKRLEDFTPVPAPNGAHLTIEEINASIGEAVVERFRRKTAR